MSNFCYEKDQFLYNGQATRIISGAIHYFRVVPEYWEDRLQKLLACGFNTVETYIPWNFHEPKKGQFQFNGMADVAQFIQIAGDLGLHVIVRPSPYICAEWEFGGLPAWLLAEPELRLRCADPNYLNHVDDYYAELLPRLEPLLCTHGGPIIAMQIENEYGSYGNDQKYLDHIKRKMLEHGMNVLLFTSDGAEDAMIQGGMMPGVLATANFGSRAEESFHKLGEYQPNAPYMCMEYWNGWFDHWGKPHHARDADDVANVLEDMLKLGGSVNFYMFHGGTNFGLYNGANCMTDRYDYQATVTSYDYDSLLNESGDPTDKYWKVRDVLSKYGFEGTRELPVAIPKKAYGTIQMTGQALLSDQLLQISSPIHTVYPKTMEKLGQEYGYCLYTTHISGPRPSKEFEVQEVRDRAQVYMNGEVIGVLERWNPDQKLSFEVPEGGATIEILVENMGRINYGPYLEDRKGITEGVRHGFQFLSEWTSYPLPLDNLSELTFDPIGSELPKQPCFYQGHLCIEEIADTFIHLDGWKKGIIFINGFNLGRYWEIGPQQTLYIPAPLLKLGDNEIIIFEQHGTETREIRFMDHAILG